MRNNKKIKIHDVNFLIEYYSVFPVLADNIKKKNPLVLMFQISTRMIKKCKKKKKNQGPKLWKHYIYITKPSSFSSVTQLCLTLWNPWTTACQASLSITNSCSLLKLKSMESGIPSNHLILCHPLLLLPSVFTASESFPVGQFFSSGGQSIGASASASDVPMNIQD